MILLVIGTILSAIWLVVYLLFEKNYKNLEKKIQKGEFFMQSFFFMGVALLDKIYGVKKNTKAVVKIKKISEIKGKANGEIYYFFIRGGKVTYVITFLPLSFILGGMFEEIIICFLGLLLTALLVFYLDYEIESKIIKRKEEIISQLPKVLSNLALLMSTGIPIRNCWEIIINTEQGFLYDELRLMEEEKRNGVTEIEAYNNLAERCPLKEVKKFISIVVQNIKKGNSDIVRLINELAQNSWQEKKYKAKIKGEIAGSKLIVPMTMMLVAILIMIIVPIFSSI